MISFSYTASWYSETKNSFLRGQVYTGCLIREYDIEFTRVRIIQKFHPDNRITYVFLDRYDKKPIKVFTSTEASKIAEMINWIEENKDKLYPFLIMNKQNQSTADAAKEEQNKMSEGEQ